MLSRTYRYWLSRLAAKMFFVYPFVPFPSLSLLLLSPSPSPLVLAFFCPFLVSRILVLSHSHLNLFFFFLVGLSNRFHNHCAVFCSGTVSSHLCHWVSGVGSHCIYFADTVLRGKELKRKREEVAHEVEKKIGWHRRARSGFDGKMAGKREVRCRELREGIKEERAPSNEQDASKHRFAGHPLFTNNCLLTR